MIEEVLIPKMTRIDKTKRRKIKIPMLNVVIILFCTLLLIASTFVNIEIRHYIVPFGLFSDKDLTPDDFIYTFSLIPQIPTLMFICSTLGKRMALTSTIIYINWAVCFSGICAWWWISIYSAIRIWIYNCIYSCSFGSW